MTAKEMSEVFAAIVMAWPSSEIAKLDKREMSLKISFWTQLFCDIESLYVKAAVMELARTSKFAPSISELRSEAEAQRDFATKALRIQYRYYTDWGEKFFIDTWGDKMIPLLRTATSFEDLHAKYLESLHKAKELKG